MKLRYFAKKGLIFEIYENNLPRIYSGLKEMFWENFNTSSVDFVLALGPLNNNIDTDRYCFQPLLSLQNRYFHWKHYERFLEDHFWYILYT